MYYQSEAVEQANYKEVYENYEQFGLDSFDFVAIDKDKLDQLAPEQGLEPTSSSPTRRPRNRRKASRKTYGNLRDPTKKLMRPFLPFRRTNAPTKGKTEPKPKAKAPIPARCHKIGH